MRLTNHQVFITGGSSGIGLELASALLARGNKVAICGQKAQALDAARALHPELVTLRCDITDPEAARDAIHRVQAELGGLSLLVNNAGILGRYDALDAASVARFEQELRVNVLAPLRFISIALPALQRAAPAAVINLNSGACYVPLPESPGYAASKAALRSLSRSLRPLLDDAGVALFEVYPPVVDTPMAAGTTSIPGGKMPPSRFVDLMLKGVLRDSRDIHIGVSRLARLLSRAAPWVLERQAAQDARQLAWRRRATSRQT